MSEPLTYAKAGGPPDDWHGLRIFNLETGQEVLHVYEVNTEEGWVITSKLDARGQPYAEGDEIAKQRIDGRFEIRRPE